MLKSRYYFAFLLVLAVVAFVPAAAVVQSDPPSRVARLSYLNGDVSFQPAGAEDWAAATLNRPLTTADRLWTGSGSRAEMHVGNAALRLGPDTGFAFLNLTDSTSQVQITQGTISVRLRELGAREAFEIDTPNVAVSLLRPGLYRIDVDPDGELTTVTVRSGYAGANADGRAYTIHAREQAHFTGGDSLSYKVNPEPGYDQFDDWCAARDLREDSATSARYVSRGVIGYEDLDDYGYWQTVPTYGSVWYPRTVVVGWAPYRFGHWAWIGPWGWTWVDDAPWGFAPFHYGRWLWTPTGWGWLPGPMVLRPVWAPALVAWVGGMHFGMSYGAPLYGWFPLGPREVYVPWYRTSRVYVNNVNITNTVINNTYITRVYNHDIQHINYINRHVPGAVTAVPPKALLEGRHIAREHINVPEKQWDSAEVMHKVPVEPTRHSLLGGSASTPAMRPPASAIDRHVVTFRKPPEASPRFAEPGQPAGHPLPAAAANDRTGPQTGAPREHPARPAPAATAAERNASPAADADHSPKASAPAKREPAALPGMGRQTREAFGTPALREPLRPTPPSGSVNASRPGPRIEKPLREAENVPQVQRPSGPAERIERPRQEMTTPRPRYERAPVQRPMRSAEVPRVSDRPVQRPHTETTRPAVRERPQAPQASARQAPGRAAESRPAASQPQAQSAPHEPRAPRQQFR